MAINKSDRARQFLPFDALKGFREALELKEIEYDEKKELSEEMCENICEIINNLDENDTLKIKYYFKHKYIIVIGKLRKIDRIKKKIILNDNLLININDIIEIEKI